MKSKQPVIATLIGAFALTAAAPAFSYDPNRDSPGAPRNLTWGPGASAVPAKATAAAMIGSPADVAAATRTVDLAGVRNINVVQGEIVKFVAGDKTFAWRFDTLNVPDFKLSDIAPKDFPAGDVNVYLAHDPAHLGG